MLAACGGAPREASRPEVSVAPAPAPGRLTTDPDLNRPAPAKLLDIDWAAVKLQDEADVQALWRRIAPTGEDWEAKLDEIPGDGVIASKLALGLLRGGNVTCVPAVAAAPRGCVKPPVDIGSPSPTSTFDDPCLRRMIALWALEALDDEDLPAARDALRAIAAIPPPESQLVATALDALPEDDHAGRLELRAIAFRAGHRELVNAKIGHLDVPFLVEAATKHHIDGALEALSAETHRPVFLAAVTDAQMHGPARAQAMIELVAVADGDKLPKDLHAALVTATRSDDCNVAAAAARQLVKRGENKFGPSRPRAKSAPPMMRSLCVLASFESLQTADEPSYLLGYIPPRGLDLVKVTYDPYNDVDTDGDGDPHTERTATLVPRDEVMLPELEDLVRAMRSCTGTTCTSEEREFRFSFKPGAGGELMLSRLEVVERPPCPSTTK